MQYFKLLTLSGYTQGWWSLNRIYPADYKPDIMSSPVEELAQMYFQDWQEVTEADYLAQEGIKPIVEYHAALEAIGDKDRIQHIPDNLLDAIYTDLVEEKRRRWAISNGWVKSEG